MATDYDSAAAFAARLAQLMEERGESQSSLSRAAGIVSSQSAISHYLAAFQTPGGEALAAFARHYDVSVDWLLGLIDERRPLARVYGWVDVDALERLLKNPAAARDLRDGSTILEAFPPAFRLVTEAEFTSILSRLRAARSSTPDVLPRTRSRLRRPRPPPGGMS